MRQSQYAWLDTVEYPFLSRYHQTSAAQMHYIDEGSGEVLLFVHGTPSWSFDFRNVIKQLRKNYRCIAVDHIGFGLSDKPRDYNYTTLQHCANLDALVMALGLEKITLVMHDFGGPIGMYLAEKYPEKIQRMVVLNSWMWSSENESEFLRLKKILNSPLLPFLYRYFNFSARFVLPASFGKIRPSKAILRQFSKPFSNQNERNGTIGFARSLLQDQAWFETLWQQKNSIANKPLLLIWGGSDKVIPLQYMHRFQSGFTNSTAHTIAEAGHFPQEEFPELVSEFIGNFMAQR